MEWVNLAFDVGMILGVNLFLTNFPEAEAESESESEAESESGIGGDGVDTTCRDSSNYAWPLWKWDLDKREWVHVYIYISM